MTQPPAPNLGPASSQFESQPPQKRGDISRFLSFPAKSGNISRSLEIARNFVPSSNLGQMVLIWHFCNNLKICYIRRGKGPHLRFCQKWKFRCWRALGYQCSYSPNPRYRRPWTHFPAATIRLNTLVENWWLVGWIIPDSRFEMVPGRASSMVEQFKILDLQLWWGGRGPRHSSVYTPFYFHYSAPIPVLLPTTHHFYHHHQHHQHSHHNCRQIKHYLHPFCHYHLCHGGNMLESHRNLHRNYYQCRH